jgi:hypothetical protein
MTDTPGPTVPSPSEPPPTSGGYPAPQGYPPGPSGQGPPGAGYGYRRGYGRGYRRNLGMSRPGQSFFRRNQLSITTFGVVALYIGIAITTRFVLIGIVPVLMSFRALRRREPLAVLAVVAGILAVVVFFAAISGRY